MPDGTGGKRVLQRLFEQIKGVSYNCHCRLSKIWADGAYEDIVEWVKLMLGWTLEIVRRPLDAKGWIVLPRRWVVERTFGWLGRYRRLSRDFEHSVASSIQRGYRLYRQHPSHAQTHHFLILNTLSNKARRLLADLTIPVEVRNLLTYYLDQTDAALQQFRINLEQWFDDCMDRVSGWYKRRTQVILALIATIACLVFNIDTLAVADHLYRAPADAPHC